MAEDTAEEDFYISTGADKFFNLMEDKGLLDLPEEVKSAMSKAGFACKGALFNSSDKKIKQLFTQIRKILLEKFESKDDDDKYGKKCADVDDRAEIYADWIFLPIHRDQIRFLVQIITDEFNVKGAAANQKQVQK